MHREQTNKRDAGFFSLGYAISQGSTEHDAELSAAYGDLRKRFYNRLESSTEKYQDYAKLHPDFFRLHEAEFESEISIT